MIIHYLPVFLLIQKSLFIFYYICILVNHTQTIMNINLIGKYRSQLMGIAILWVMLYHLPTAFPSFPLLHRIKDMGYGGVDIFMFLSGFGIFYSLKSSLSTKEFYQKRLIRILPYYLPIVLFFYLFLYYKGEVEIGSILLNISTLAYWIGSTSLFDWYIPTILLFYLLSPLLYKSFLKHKNLTLGASMIITLIVMILIKESQFAYLYKTITRFPIYILGFSYGHYCSQNPPQKIKFWIIGLMIISIIGGVAWWRYLIDNHYHGIWQTHGLAFIPFWFIAIPLCFFLSYLLSLLPRYRYPVLAFIGSYTLALYIFHERIMSLLIMYNIDHVNFYGLILTFPIAIIWTKLIDYIVSKFTSTQTKKAR